MEQVLYYLLPLTDPNCLKTVPWPITTFKEAAEFRNTATLLINVSLCSLYKAKIIINYKYIYLWRWKNNDLS